MTDNLRLLVPVALDVLVVNAPLISSGSNVDWARWIPSYDLWQQYDSPLPPDPDAQLGKPAVGVHLKWAMPDALTNGRLDTSSGTFEFPLVPNRWLVTRLSPGAQPDAPKVAKSWLIESDVKTSETSASVYLDPTAVEITPDNITDNQIFIGRNTPLDDVTEAQIAETATVEAYLRAVGPGDVSFAAYQPAVATVFSFHDSLSDLGDPGDGIPLTYVLTGWYSQTGDDPLAGVTTYVPGGPWQTPSCTDTPLECWEQATPKERFEQLLARYQWTLDSGPPPPPSSALRLLQPPVPDQPPAATLYHALTYEVMWQNAQVPPSPNGGPADWASRLKVIVGSTATEALAALAQTYADEAGLGDAGKYVGELLEAAQLGALPLIDQPDGQQRLDRRIHDARFGSDPGGTLWRVVRFDNGKPVASDDTTVTEAVKAWVDGLNATQRTFDLASRTLTAMQRDLYGLWWKKHKANVPFPPTPPPGYWTQQRWDDLKAELTSLLPGQAAAVERQLKLVGSLRGSLPPPTDGQGPIDAWVVAHPPPDGLPPGLQLKPAAMPRYWHANDPVVLTAGIERSNTHGADGRGHPDGLLSCRLPDAVVTGIEYDNVTLKLGTGADRIPPSDVPVPNGPGVPDLTALFGEAVFVDPSNAIELAAAAGKGSDQSFVTGLAAAIAARKGLIGTAPAKLGLGKWGQPFTPLYLEWSVNFFPTYKPVTFPNFKPPGDGQAWVFDPSAWSFDGSDYRYQGGSLPEATFSIYSGRTVLSAHSGDNLVSRITDFLQTPPRTESPEVKELLEKLDEPYLLSQALSGLTRQLAMWVEEQNVPPFGTVAGESGQPWSDLIDAQFHAVPAVGAGDVARVEGRGIKPYFFPIRAGFIVFTKLSLIDVFGQVIDLLWANDNQQSEPGLAETFEPILGAGMAPDGPEALKTPPGFAMLRPRLSPSTRLNLTLEPVDGDDMPNSVALPYDDQAPPVGPSSPSDGLCGWVLPNHLDFGLSVYGADGTALGELIALPRGADVTVNWQPAPGPNGVECADIPNAYLRQIVEGFAPDDPTAGAEFLSFLKAIDETLWTVDPFGGRSDQNLSVLIGRPLAVLRAQLQLALNGGAVGDQSWQFTPPVVSEPVTWGYEDITFPVRLGDASIHNDGLIGYYLDDDYSVFNSVYDGDSPYIRHIGPGDDIQLSPNGTCRAELTMLVDPRAPVHAFTGILPVKEISFPPALLDSFLTTLELTFRTGPMITDNQSVRIPAPAERHGTFHWLQQSAPGIWATDPVVRVGSAARIPATRQVIREGWLGLRIDDQTKESS